MGYTPGAIEPAMMEKFIGFDVNRGSCGWGNWETALRVLEDGLREGPWVMGEHFSAADVMLGSSVYFLKQFGLLGENTVLDPYLERCLARPAYQTALAREDEAD
jgi:glutathione S-transferase